MSMEINEVIKWGTGLIVFLVSLRYTIHHFKTVRTISYIERFNTPNMIEIRAAVDEWSDKSRGEQIEQLMSDKNTYNKVTLIYNIITEIGVSYRYRVINRKMAREIFDPLIPHYWLKIEPYISFKREMGVDLGKNFKIIVDAINQNRNKKKYDKLAEKLGLQKIGGITKKKLGKESKETTGSN